MNDLQELINIAEKLCNSLDKSLENEKRFTDDIALHIEKMNWEACRMMNDLKEIKQYCGV
jgi:hypothetical protein